MEHFIAEIIQDRKTSPEVAKAYAEGFVNNFIFLDGLFSCESINRYYKIPSCRIIPKPCLITKIIVYRVIAPDGIRGIAILSFEQINEY